MYDFYNPYQQFNQPMQRPQQPVQQPTTNKIVVSGIEEVRQRQQPYNSDMLYLDNDKPIIYEKKVDSVGQFEVKIFAITEKTNEVDTKPEYALKSDLTAIMDEIKTIKEKLNEPVKYV